MPGAALSSIFKQVQALKPKGPEEKRKLQRLKECVWKSY
jgi:hypothetical protein